LKQEEGKYLGKNYQRVNKTIARKHYNNGGDVLIQSVSFCFAGSFESPHHFNSKMTDNEPFKHLVSTFEYYHCSNESSDYAKFFIEIDLKIK